MRVLLMVRYWQADYIISCLRFFLDVLLGDVSRCVMSVASSITVLGVSEQHEKNYFCFFF